VSMDRLLEHRAVWRSKPVLQDVYAVWFRRLSDAIPGDRIIEVGAGPGFLAEHARRSRPQCLWLATDLLATPWNQVTADALGLPIRDASIDGVVGLDVLHHFAQPRRFFQEAARVLAPGGAIALVEPWVTLLSYPIYRWLHPEGCDLQLDPWQPFGHDTRGKQAFEGNGAIPWRILRSTPAREWRNLGFEAPELTLLNGFAYLLSLGFRRGSLLPRRLAHAVIALDSRLAPLSRWTAMRTLAVWRRI
jgi:SAM-dependent methyltransferase